MISKNDAWTDDSMNNESRWIFQAGQVLGTSRSTYLKGFSRFSEVERFYQTEVGLFCFCFYVFIRVSPVYLWK